MSSAVQPNDNPSSHPKSAPDRGDDFDAWRAMPTRVEVLILGGGPAGLEAALALRARGLDVHVFEAGKIGASLRRWGHIRMFSPWEMNTSIVGREISACSTSAIGAHDCPTGAEFVDHYLEPLAASELLRGRIHEQTRALGATRRGVLKSELIGAPERRQRPFRVVWRFTPAGGRPTEGYTESRFLIDATGVADHPNPTGDGGVPAPGEEQFAARIRRDLSALNPAAGERLGRRVLIVGGGYSAATAGVCLTESLRSVPGSEVHWAFRGSRFPIAAIDNDPLAERRALTERAHAIASDPPDGMTIHAGVSVERFEPRPDGIAVVLRRGDGSSRVVEVDDVLSLTGYRPDLHLLSELQVHHCYATDGIMRVAAHLLGGAGGGSGDCLTVSSGGLDTLRSPEADLFVLGSKSYGRSSQYLLRTGIEQAEQVADEVLRLSGTAGKPSLRV
ncbi:MAG: NAD(P)-binding domain-containing protein [Planctomycetota bacterium]